MLSEKKIVVDGVIKESLPNATFRVTLNDGRLILAHVAGKMRLYHIKILLGDRVQVEMSPYEQEKCLIIYRSK